MAPRERKAVKSGDEKCNGGEARCCLLITQIKQYVNKIANLAKVTIAMVVTLRQKRDLRPLFCIKRFIVEDKPSATKY
jgi:hypothetical protein